MNDDKLGGRTILLFILALFFVLMIQGAIPFLAAPTLGQAVWVTGFSQSFLNDSVFSIYAHNFGAPAPAAIVFGLAGAWPAAVFIKLGLQPVDAYTAVVALWITVAFSSMYRLGRYFSVSPHFAILGALAWGSMPVIWGHAGYSMLSTGIALLPFYFLTVLHLFDVQKESYSLDKVQVAKKVCCYFVVCVIAIFMDGYSFMMFAVGAGLLWLTLLVKMDGGRKRVLYRFSFPVYLLGLIFAYLLYVLYTGKAQFARSPIEFFRGWGVDIMFMLLPTQGLHWIPDMLGWSVHRTSSMFFGDFSVWTTSFSSPLIIGAIVAVVFLRNKSKKVAVLAFSLIAIFGFYMALGPSLKVNSIKPASQLGIQLMEKEYAIAPTGSAILAKKLPGFRSMRASYRWGALGVFSSLTLLLLMMAESNNKKNRIIASVIVAMVAILNLPNLPLKLKNDMGNRDMFLSLDSELIDEMRGTISPNEKVAFLPWRNDFLASYAAARLNAVTFNIGGNKNLEKARVSWPPTMSLFPTAVVDDDFANRILLLLAKKEVDVVILPYIDMLWAAHFWPYPAEFKEWLAPTLRQLDDSGLVQLEIHAYYATVRLNSKARVLVESGEWVKNMEENLCMPPICLKKNDFSTAAFMLSGAPLNGIFLKGVVDDDANKTKMAYLFSQVGHAEKGRFVSDGRAGFLHNGPYVPMRQGHYRFVLRGTATAVSETWVDIVSGNGKIEHARFTLRPTKESGDGVLAAGEINLDRAVADMEIRVYVNADDKVALDSYELLPLN